MSLDNDTTHSTDRDYTHGTKFAYMYDKTPSLLDSVFKDREKRVTYILGQYMYTPDNISTEELIEEDRPYGGWLYLGYSFEACTVKKCDVFEIDVGVTGDWAGTEDTQTAVHELFDARKPMGWDNQLGEEVGIDLIWQEKLKYKMGNYMEVIPHYGMSLGTIHTFANVGFMVRVG